MTTLSDTEQRALFELYDIPNIVQLRNLSIARNALSTISNQLKELQHRDWERRLALLQILQIIHYESLHVHSLYKTLRKLVRKNKSIATGLADALVLQIQDRRSEITKQVSFTIIDIAKGLKHDMINILIILFSALLDRMKIGNPLIRTHFTNAIRQILIEVHDKSLIHDIYHQFKEIKHVDVQHELGKLMKLILVQWDIKSMIKSDTMISLNKPMMRINIEQMIINCINHKIAETRDLGIDLFWIYILNYYIDYKDVFLSKIDEGMQEMIEDKRPYFYVIHKKSIFNRVSKLFQKRQSRINSKYKGIVEKESESIIRQNGPANVEEIGLEISEMDQKQKNILTREKKSEPVMEKKRKESIQKVFENENIQRRPCCVC